MGWTFDEWSYDEHLVVLNEEGVYRVYDIQGDYSQHSLGAEAQEAGVVDAVIYETGLVALTGHLTLIEIKGWEDGRPTTLAVPGVFCSLVRWGDLILTDTDIVSSCVGLVQPPPSWAVLPPDQTISRHVEVLMSVDSTIMSVDNLEVIDQVRILVRKATLQLSILP